MHRQRLYHSHEMGTGPSSLGHVPLVESPLVHNR